MRDTEKLQRIKDRLGEKGIYDVRQIMRALQIHSDSPQKNKMIDAIMLFAQGIIEAQPPSTRGAPPKSNQYDEDLVAEIRNFRALCVLNTDADKSIKVSDGGRVEKYAEIPVSGVLNRTDAGYFITADGSVLEVADSFINRYSLQIGDKIAGVMKSGGGLLFIDSVNGLPAQKINKRRDFLKLTRIYPKTRVSLADDPALRMIDLFAPLALGQRVFVSAGEHAGTTALLKRLVKSTALNENAELCFLLLNCRPEEVSDFTGEFKGALFYNTFDAPAGVQLNTARLAFEYCKRQAELDKNVVLVADGLFFAGISADILKQLLFCAGNTAEGGSITLIAGLPNDFAEYKQIISTANSVITLSSELARERVYPAIDAKNTYAERDEVLLNDEELRTADNLRGSFTAREIVEIFKKSRDNSEIIEKYRDG